jgi:hypothetical protein
VKRHRANATVQHTDNTYRRRDTYTHRVEMGVSAGGRGTHGWVCGPLVCIALHHRVQRIAGVHQPLTPRLAPGSAVSVAACQGHSTGEQETHQPSAADHNAYTTCCTCTARLKSAAAASCMLRQASLQLQTDSSQPSAHRRLNTCVHHSTSQHTHPPCVRPSP